MFVIWTFPNIGPELFHIDAFRLFGLTLDQASQALQRAGLQLGNAIGYKTGAKVQVSDPVMGEKVPRNTAVDIAFRRGLFG